MPPLYLLDTNVVCYFVRGTFPALRQRLVNTPIESMAVSAVTEAELLRWVAGRPQDERTRVSVGDFLARVPSLAGVSRAARVLALDLTLVTHDAAFALVDSLRREDWTAADGN